MWQIPQKLLNDYFTNVIIEKVIKSKFINSYEAYVRMKNKMIKTQQNSLYKWTKGWFGDSLWKIKQGSLKKAKLNVSVTFVSKNKQSLYVFIIFLRD